MRSSLTGLDKKKLRLWLLLFFTALAVPTSILINHAYSQLKWEAFHHHQQLAEELANRIDKRLAELVNSEEARSFTDYTFLNVTGDKDANFIQRSPLSAFPVTSTLPGLIGHFQIDSSGHFTTPLLPLDSEQSYGIASKERHERLALQNEIHQILSQNRLVTAPRIPRPDPALVEAVMATDAPMELEETEDEMMSSQSAFDQLNLSSSQKKREQEPRASNTLGRVEDLKFDSGYPQKTAEEHKRKSKASRLRTEKKRSARKEQNILPQRLSELKDEADDSNVGSNRRITTFESEIDPFEISLLDSGHFILFRKVWRNGQRYIQGAMIERSALLKGIVEPLFRETALSQMSSLAIAYRGDIFTAISDAATNRYLSSAEELSGALLYQSRLSAPLSEMELLFTITRLPAGPGGAVVGWLAAIMALVLIGGFYLIYRLGLGQIGLARQQQDFISAVSHELKTPLTSIRMYGEMLREGWASEEKKHSYYDYIFDESERLSRLINNVLQLARMTRNELQVDLKQASAGELIDTIRSKVSSQIERAGFEIEFNCEGSMAESMVEIDTDYFTQIVINLVDNAIKFSAKAEQKKIEISCRIQRDKLLFTIRDYGPGIAKEQMKKIFKLFYRSENELTRETVGTGIGLALVNQLVQAMEGEVDVVNCEPGAEFRVLFVLVK